MPQEGGRGKHPSISPNLVHQAKGKTQTRQNSAPVPHQKAFHDEIFECATGSRMGSAKPNRAMRDIRLSAASSECEWDSYFGGAEQLQNTWSHFYSVRAVEFQYSSCSSSGMA